MTYEDRANCVCVSEGFACHEKAAQGEWFCPNCLPGGDCPEIHVREKQAGDEESELYPPCPCGCGAPDLDEGLDVKTLLEVQLVVLVRKFEALDDVLGLLDGANEDENAAAGHIMDAMTLLEEGMLELLSQWVHAQD